MNKNQIREEFRKVLLEKVEKAFEIYLGDNAVSKNFASSKTVIHQIAEEQTDLAFDEFMQEADEVSENERNDQVREYVDEAFDHDFFVVKIEEKIDFDQIREDYREELLLFLMNTEPYSVVPREYWYTQARRVENIDELSKYASQDGLEVFVEKYAAEWEEVAKENQD